MKNRIIILTLIILTFLFIGSVCAQENTTIITDDSLNGDDNYSDIYIDSNKEDGGDGLSPETAYNNLNYSVMEKIENNGVIHLADGNYELPNKYDNYTIIGNGENTIIDYCWFNMGTSSNLNYQINLINLTFDITSKREVSLTIWNSQHTDYNTSKEYYDISLESANFKFINCTFINSSIVAGQYMQDMDYREGAYEGTVKSFENCRFINYPYNNTKKEYANRFGVKITEFESPYLITSFIYTQFNFNNCTFESINADCIVNSYGGQTGTDGTSDGVYIYNSTFKKCNITGVVKALQISRCIISNCSYDFDVSETTDFTSPFYVNTTDHPVTETVLTVTVKGNTLIVTLTDVNNTPLVDAEVEVVTNNKVSYKYTDENGQFTLTDLDGTYSFEFTYPGDDDYASSKAVKNITFTSQDKINTVISASKVTATYNVAKNLVITLKDANGNLLVGKTVKIKVGTISKTLTTNSKGQVSVNVAGLVPKTYTATFTFSGDDNYSAKSNTAQVVVKKATPKITAAKKTFKVKTKTKKYTITLKDNKRKVLKKAKVTLKVKGKTYKATTNAKGKATFKITKLTKKGTFKAVVKFTGNSKFKAVSKKVNITVKK